MFAAASGVGVTFGSGSGGPVGSASADSIRGRRPGPGGNKKPADVQLKNVGSWSSLANLARSEHGGTPGGRKSSSAMQSFVHFRKQAKEKQERVRYYNKNISCSCGGIFHESEGIKSQGGGD